MPALTGMPKGSGMNINALAAILTASQNNQLPLSQIAKLDHLDLFVFPDCHAVHTALFGQMPDTRDFEIFGENAHGVIAIGGYAISGGGSQACFRCGLKSLLCENWSMIGSELKCHGSVLLFDYTIIVA